VTDARPIRIRMTEAKAKLIELRRIPRAFYLGAADYKAFVRTKPKKVQALFRGKPREEYGFDQVPVRPAGGSSNKFKSRLFCNHGTAVGVPTA
jgi:hypothetical protein